MTDEEKTYKRSLRRMNKARDFPRNTCPGSRHTAMCAERLIKDGKYHMCDEEPGHIGNSIAMTTAALWEARSKLQELGYTWKIAKSGKSKWVKDE